MKLYEAFNIARGDVVSLVGAGGKTSTLIALAGELADEGWRVLATTTTHIGEDQLGLMAHVVEYNCGSAVLEKALDDHRFVFARA